MKNVVITGGTDGIGRGLAQTFLDRGDRVVVVGTSQTKGDAFLSAARDRGATDRASFVRADLSLVESSTRLVQRLTAELESLDVLVLGARYHRSTRVETPDGFEANFALFYLSRYLLSHGLVGPLSRAEHAVVLNFGAAGLTGPPRWDDLQLRKQYHGVAAMAHGGRLNDLLALDFVHRYPDAGVRYVINHPGVVATSFAGEYDGAPATGEEVAHLRTVGKPVDVAVRQILPFLDRPGAEEPASGELLTAVVEGVAVRRDPASWSVTDARRLHEITRKLLLAAPDDAPGARSRARS